MGDHVGTLGVEIRAQDAEDARTLDARLTFRRRPERGARVRVPRLTQDPSDVVPTDCVADNEDVGLPTAHEEAVEIERTRLLFGHDRSIWVRVRTMSSGLPPRERSLAQTSGA